MLASVFIIIACSALFLYWFHYTCLLVMRQGQVEYAVKVASTVRLSFNEVQQALRTQQHTAALDGLHEALENDYHLLTDLLEQITGDASIERRILTLDYKAMKIWYKVGRAHPNLLCAKNALTEMSSIVGYFAAEVGQNAAA